MNIYQKLVEVRKAVTYLKKEANGPQYNYVASSQVLASLREKMNELGLLLVPRIEGHEVREHTAESKDKFGNPKFTTTYFTELIMSMTWINADKPEETIVCPWYGQGVDIAGEKGVGKALTYAEKYFLLKQFNIPTDKDDPDAFQGKHDTQPQQKAQPQQPKPQPQQPQKQQPKPQQQKLKPEPQPTAGDNELEITMADYEKIEPIEPTTRVLLDKPRKALHAIRNELGLDEAKFKQLITETCLPKLASEFGFIPFKVNSLNDLAILDEVVIETLIRGLNTVAKQHKQPNGGLGQTVCANCHNPISDKVFKFSSERYGKGLCMDCQKTHQL